MNASFQEKRANYTGGEKHLKYPVISEGGSAGSES